MKFERANVLLLLTLAAGTGTASTSFNLLNKLSLWIGDEPNRFASLNFLAVSSPKLGEIP